ncbi:MAG: leucine-rich repeat domain-containing protein [Candidatus Pseudomonas phytovorans]|uniref:Leucine-rich repeat domain-containing protein n=1 Tax=Candidatus Pseudomonas phytovorans TaxID=3121377 RepID=A0AAJ6B9Z8_9PSED|nr:leucine-rich repeat domain-containing protein [Pseudomonas sp.]WEK28687.1 MAG: leucine-rich repeat domain-containing protein [Pseudomonas sp.]
MKPTWASARPPHSVCHSLCRAVEEVLSREQRHAIGINEADGITLHQRVLAWIDEHRAELAQRLWGPSARRLKPQGWLRGGRPLEMLPPHPRQTSSLSAAYRRLFPNASDAEFAGWLGNEQEAPNLPDMRSATERLRDLQRRLDSLRSDLHQWAQPDPIRPHQRHRAIRPIINAWRRLTRLRLDSGGSLFSLDLSGLGLQDEDLASLALPDDFTHIEHVSLANNRPLSQLPAEFLERFPNLERLILTNCRFDHLPRLARPDSLRWLDLDSNRITWDGQAQYRLNQYANLAVLDLTDNPLLTAPDLHWLGDLKSLFLSGCSLTELPQGLELITEPIALDLSDNQLQRLPASFTVSTSVADAIRLESDWLGEPVLAQIEAYNSAHQVDLLVSESDYLEFFDEGDPAHPALWQRLPRQYRRDLRPLLEVEPFLSRPHQARREFWRRLMVIDANAVWRPHWLAQPAADLFNLPL